MSGHTVWVGLVGYVLDDYGAESVVALQGENEEEIAAMVRTVIDQHEAVTHAWYECRCEACDNTGYVYVTIPGHKKPRYDFQGRGLGTKFPCPYCHGQTGAETRVELVLPVKTPR